MEEVRKRAIQAAVTAGISPFSWTLRELEWAIEAAVARKRAEAGIRQLQTSSAAEVAELLH